ncbi:MAG TPA: hypothetical protein VFE04_10025 [Puia sp.]|nr:hypothetical protein [Puia sp.]
MKQHLLNGRLFLTFTIVCLVSCKKTVEQAVSSPNTVAQHDSTSHVINTTTNPYPVTPTQECIYAPNYGDTILYPQPSAGFSYASPKKPSGVQGTYLSWPGGLVMDSKTGVINLTLSQTGQRYDVAFVQYGTTDTCISQVIIGGVAYMDSVYSLSQSQATAVPYVDANPGAAPPCQNNQYGQGCAFDYGGFAKRQGIQVNYQTGAIALQQTVRNAFGRNPVNGATVNTVIFYRLNNNSNYALQNIQLQLIYYNKRSDIPNSLLATIASRQSNVLNTQLISKGPSARPPLIVIVRN